MSTIIPAVTYRDGFHGVKKTIINEALGRKLSEDQYYLIHSILTYKIPPMIQDLLVQAITEESEQKLVEYITEHKIDSEKKFSLRSSKYILVEVVQDKLRDYEKYHNYKKYKQINELFRSILYDVIFKYLVTLKSYDFNVFIPEFIDAYMNKELEAQIGLLEIQLPEKARRTELRDILKKYYELK